MVQKRQLPARHASPPAPAPYRVRATLRAAETNETAQSVSDRFTRIEDLLEKILQNMDTQFRRIASMQAELDHIKAKLGAA